MKTRNFLSAHLCHRLFLLLFAAAWIGASAPLEAASGGHKLLKMDLSSDRRTTKVTIPDGVATVTVQRFQREGGWQKVISTKAVSKVMKFKLPANGKNVRWRAIGWLEKAVVLQDKFPANFYKGQSRFGSVKSGNETGFGSKNLADSPGMVAATAGSVTTDVPVEADIWKVDGDTVYFFNQLRGLQVLDLKNPADPRITASLRLPAMGQDLYLMPGSSGDRSLVLLTEGWSSQGGQWTRINLVKVSGGTAKITHTQEVTGSLADSRLVGSRLILATTEWNYSDVVSTNGWSSRSRLSEWLLAPDTAPLAAGETLIEGDSPLISSGPDWLALAVHPSGKWDVSEVSVFAVRPSGLIRMAKPVRTTGSVSGKFGMQWSGNVLTTISERNWSAGTWSPSTVLENFRAWAPEVIHTMQYEDVHLGRLELAKGESLFATRFAGDKAYVVTFLRTDPLWVVDLSDPKNPVVAGHIEVPGWSSHLEPIGDLLFAIGWESGTVAASLFDVADPAAPKLLRRLKLGDSGSYSEAMWDEKALKVLPAAGLALIPLASYDWQSATSSSVLQLLDVDLKARDLRLRGKIAHAFDARRADLIGDAVVSISQRVLVAADVTDRDAPTVLSEVSLAWPVDRVLEAGAYLLQIEDGSWYGSGRPTVRVSPAKAPEQILSETDLGDGTVKAADYRDGKLYVVRETGSGQSMFYRSPITGNTGENKLVLDIYDASAAPVLTLLGSCSMNPGSGGQVAGDHLLWPQPNRPAVLLDFRYSYWFWRGPVMMIDSPVSLAAAASPVQAKSALMADARPYWVPEKAPRLVLFDTAKPEAPVAAEPVDLGPSGSSLNDASEAGNGLIVAGISHYHDWLTGKWLDSGEVFESARVVEVGTSGPPVLRPLIDLSGKLFGVGELDANGFLAYTRTSGTDATTFQVSACDGFDAFLIAGFEAPAYAVATVGGRRVFVAKGTGVERHHLTAQGTFATESTLKIGWQPDSLRWVHGTLIGASWNSVFAAAGEGDAVKKWAFPTWNPGLGMTVIASDGGLLVPFGDYGVERLSR